MERTHSRGRGPHKGPSHADADASLWDRRSANWDDVCATPGFQDLANRVRDAAALRRDDRVVDLGAGTGLLSLRVAAEVKRVTAVDSSRAMLVGLEANAKNLRYDNILTVFADMRSLPLPDESATLVVSNYAFHHLSDAEKHVALAEARRILVPGGRLVISDMMFRVGMDARSRRLLRSKVVALGRLGPGGVLRLARIAARIAVGRWEHPAPPETWARMLEERHYVDVSVEPLHHEGGIALARRP